METSPAATALRPQIEDDFRDRIALFYRSLRVTPPYHTVEKAALALREALASLQDSALQGLQADDAARTLLYVRMIKESGLAQKHRGIIAGLLAQHPERLAPECRALAAAFRR